MAKPGRSTSKAGKRQCLRRSGQVRSGQEKLPAAPRTPAPRHGVILDGSWVSPLSGFFFNSILFCLALISKGSSLLKLHPVSDSVQTPAGALKGSSIPRDGSVKAAGRWPAALLAPGLGTPSPGEKPGPGLSCPGSPEALLRQEASLKAVSASPPHCHGERRGSQRCCPPTVAHFRPVLRRRLPPPFHTSPRGWPFTKDCIGPSQRKSRASRLGFTCHLME